jgi:hypothetical protein
MMAVAEEDGILAGSLWGGDGRIAVEMSEGTAI